MANPNIVGVVSIYAGNAAWALTTGVTTTLLTVAADVIVKVNSIIATNTHATNATALTLDVNGIGTTVTGVTGTSLATTAKIASTINIPADDVLSVIDKPIYLMEADVLRGGASVATCDLFISYEVINDA
tara:strand:- start:65 stop:454 length:390 start_codon:yes stop_codon:yes gene_type:complete